MDVSGEVRGDEVKGDESSMDVGLDDSVYATITVVCNDGRRFEVRRSYLSLSVLVTKALCEDPCVLELPLPGVRGEVFEKILEYLNHHEGKFPRRIDHPAPSDKMCENVEDKWDATWVDSLWSHSRRLLVDVMEGSNFMDVSVLTELCACKIATRLKGIPVEHLRSRIDLNGRDDDDCGKSVTKDVKSV